MHLAEMELEIQRAAGMPNWYALFTRHQHEKAVAFALSNKSYEVYLPLYRSVHRWQDRAKALWLPVVPMLRVYPRGNGQTTPNTHDPGFNPHREMGRAPGHRAKDSIGCDPAYRRVLPQRGDSPVSPIRRSRTGQNRAANGAGRDFDPHKRGGAAGRVHGNAGPVRCGGDRWIECRKNWANPGAKAIPSGFSFRLNLTSAEDRIRAIQWTLPYFNSMLPER